MSYTVIQTVMGGLHSAAVITYWSDGGVIQKSELLEAGTPPGAPAVFDNPTILTTKLVIDQLAGSQLTPHGTPPTILYRGAKSPGWVGGTGVNGHLEVRLSVGEAAHIATILAAIPGRGTLLAFAT